MKTKLSLFAFLLIPILSSAHVCVLPTGYSFWIFLGQNVWSLGGVPANSPSSCFAGWDGRATRFSNSDYTSSTRVESYYDAVGSCPSGQSPDSSKVCSSPTGLHANDGNPTGCKSAGGYYLKDTTCNTGNEAIKKVLSDPKVVIGAGLMFNGLLWTAAGLATIPLGGGGSLGVGIGINAMVGGLGTLLVGLDGKIAFSSPDPSAPSATVTTPEGIKVKLIDNPNGTSSVVKSDPNTGKVTDITQISQATKDAFNKAMAEMPSSPYVSQLKATTSDQPIANTTPPSVTLAGTSQTTIDYATNTATTVTNTPQSTVENPSTTTSTAPIITSQNSDGTVTTTKMDPTGQFVDSWTVTGANGGFITYTVQPEPTGTGTTGTGTSGTGTTGSSGGSSASDNTAEKIINAQMPGYNFGTSGDFTNPDKSVVSGMASDITTMFTNIQGQLDSARSTFDSTKAMLNGSWKAPVFPAGSCGDSMSFNFHGRNVDFCPPVMNFTSQYSPLFSSVTSIAGTGLAISIFLGGF